MKATALVDDPDPRGAERKHKVFWVEPCETEAAAAEEEEQKEEETEVAEQEERRDGPPGSQKEKEEAGPTPQAAGDSSEEVERSVTPAATAAPGQPQVMGVAVERAERAAPSSPPAAQRLARTGAAGLLAPFGAALVVAGAMLQLAALFRRRRAG